MIRWLWLDRSAPESAPAPSHTLNHAVVFLNLIRVWGDVTETSLNAVAVEQFGLFTVIHSVAPLTAQWCRKNVEVVGQNTKVEIYNFLPLLVFQVGIADQQG